MTALADWGLSHRATILGAEAARGSPDWRGIEGHARIAHCYDG
jgi:hypothetical protein